MAVCDLVVEGDEAILAAETTVEHRMKLGLQVVSLCVPVSDVVSEEVPSFLTCVASLEHTGPRERVIEGHVVHNV